MAITAETKNATKVYGTKTVLDGVSLQVNKGEILALLGPNGSGKTTLLRILAFIENLTNGEILFKGEAITIKNTEEMRLHSTLVFQKTTFFDTSVYSNLAYGLKLRKVPTADIDERVSEALRIVKLEGFEKRPAKKLSGGEQQRVAIARALALRTELLLLDEPTANMDPKNASIVEEAIAAINRNFKTTIVLATHNMFQAETLPTRIALMSEGRITEVGEPSEIFSKLSRNLAVFAAVENTFKGTAADTGSGTAMVDLGNGVGIEISSQKFGEVSVFVNPQDIILSKKVVETSARNVFKGKISAIAESGSLVKLTVDVGKAFRVQITKRSFVEMGLNLGAEVFIAFKASSVQVL